MIFTKNLGTERRKITIGNIKVGRVRIYKFNTFKAFTETESNIYNDRKKNNDELKKAISQNKQIRRIDDKYLKEDFEISVFENDITRLAFEDRGITEADYQLLDEIVYMEIFHNEIMWQILKDGIYIDDKEYMLFSATTGQVRNSTITLMRKDFFEKHKGYLMVGLSKERINTHTNNVKKDLGMNVGKYLSYNALPLSSSVLPDNEIDIERCIVVKGLETVITDNVKYVDIQTDKDGQCHVADTPKEYITKDIEIEHTDGAGMFLPGELPSSCQIRGGYFKGAMFPFDFRLFSNKVAHNSVIPDAWGDMVDVEKEDIRFVLTTSQLKMWKEYDSWEEYKKYFIQEVMAGCTMKHPNCLRYYGYSEIPTKENKDKVISMLNTYGLKDFIYKYPSNLSGGMKQRAALIRTLAINPDILLLDEPFSALDYQTRLAVSDDVWKIIKNEKKTTIMITHDVAEAISMADRVIVLSDRPAKVKKIYTIDMEDKGNPTHNRNLKEFRFFYNDIWKDIDIHV